MKHVNGMIFAVCLSTLFASMLITGCETPYEHAPANPTASPSPEPMHPTYTVPEPKPLCSSGEERPCYTGHSVTRGVGECHDGVETCVMTASGPNWNNNCINEAKPLLAGDVCMDSKDNDCNGIIDDSAVVMESVLPSGTKLNNGEQIVHRFVFNTGTSETNINLMELKVKTSGVSIGQYRVLRNDLDITDSLIILYAGSSLDLKVSMTTSSDFKLQFNWQPDFYFSPVSHTDTFTLRAMVLGVTDSKVIHHAVEQLEVICSKDKGTTLSN